MSTALEAMQSREPGTEETGIRWEPQEGQILTGVFERADSVPTEYGPLGLAEIRDEEGRLWTVWMKHTILKDRFKSVRPAPGDTLALRYDGLQEGKSNTYNTYTVINCGAGVEPGPHTSTVPEAAPAPSGDGATPSASREATPATPAKDGGGLPF